MIQPEDIQLTERLRGMAEEIHPAVVRWRRHLHMHPELSFEEAQTAAYVCRVLDELGIPYVSGVAGHGIVATISGQDPGHRLIALRADMDALPIQEISDMPYRSVHDGVMHACGHDVHTANLLGAAALLQRTRSEWKGSFRLLFQPAEEKFPGGASLMIDAGVLDNPRVACILGLHVYPQMEAGRIGMRAGNYMASADEIYMTVRGRGGHAALPQYTVDPIVVTAQLITALQTMVSRRSDPTVPSVLTFGKIWSDGGATNVIPDEVHLEGTFRTMHESWRDQAHREMRSLAEGLVQSMGGEVKVHIDKGYPVLYNDPDLTARMMQLSRSYMGEECVEELPIRMTAEDFAYYSHEIPACFFRIGTSNQHKGIGAPLHTPRFDVDESCLLHSTGLTAWLAVNALNGQVSY